MVIDFVIPGEPKGKGRPRFSKVGAYVKTYTPADTASYENLVKVLCMEQKKRFSDTAQIKMEILTYYGIPKATPKYKREKMLLGEIRPIKKPDADNVAKIICDALNGVAYKDDTQVVDLHIKRYYSSDPRVEVFMEEV